MLHESAAQNEISPAERLANEARARINEVYRTSQVAYANITNYIHNNGQNVTPAQFLAALGADRKDFEYVYGGLKRFILRVNPGAKDELNALVPRKTKKAAK